MNASSRTRALLASLVAVLVVGAPPAASQPGGDDPLRHMQYALDRIDAAAAWTRSRGAGTVIAVLDTGVHLNHEDLRPKIVGGRDFVDGGDQPMDRNGHGTHIAGIAAAATGNGLGIAGVAPDAMLMPLRVLDANGLGREPDVIDAIDYAVERAAELGMRLVINMSLTDLQSTETRSPGGIEEAVRRAWQAGAVIVAAVGNASLPFSDYPAAGPNIIAVGATDEANRRAAFSNRGPTVVAPGDNIVSTFWDEQSPADNGLYASGSGTSMAAPIVAGVAALLLAAGYDNRTAVHRIVETATDLGPPGRDDEFGYGLVNAARALQVPVDSRDSGAVPGVAGVEGEFEEVRPPGAMDVTDGGISPSGPGKTAPGLVAAAALLTALGAALANSRMAVAIARRRGPGAAWTRSA